MKRKMPEGGYQTGYQASTESPRLSSSVLVLFYWEEEPKHKDEKWQDGGWSALEQQ
tara:strand:+ start:112 stop:279 length:168 start_codon:yes stop_codon:yes gene_type:complete